MTLKYLLDTNIVSEPLRPAPHKKVLRSLERHQAEIAIASIVWHELLLGCYRLPKSIRRAAIERYLYEVVAPSIPILGYDASAAEWHASERARLMSLGRTPPFAVGQIAAIARANDLILVTLNLSDYDSFQDLALEDWR